MASFWHKIPFVRLLLPLTVGIGINIFFPIDIVLTTALLFISLLFIPLSTYFFKKIYLNQYTGFAINITFFLLGVFLNQLQNQQFNNKHYANLSADYLIVKINEQPKIKKNSVKAVGSTIAIIKNNQTTACTGKILLYFKKDSLANYPKYGNLIIIKPNYTEINPPQNPNEFNYKRYLAFNQIFYQYYVVKNQYVLLNQQQENLLFKYAYAIQLYIKNVLNNYVATPNEIGVAQALLYGYDDDINPEIFKAYSNTGTLHVLAVSGMHVGIIFWVLNLLLNPLNKHKKLVWLKHVLLLLLIWGYSVLCGLSPSILRATVMLSMFIVAEIINRKTNVFNTLALSAFILIMYNTNIVANVGFQLSYLAVLGIVGVHPFLYKQLQFTNTLTDTIWKIISVSISAQFATFPIGLLYFHQFPVYFLFSNLLIIPLTTMVIYSGLLLLLTSPFLLIAKYIGLLVKWLIATTNFLVMFVAKLPFAFIDGISINIPQTIVIYLMCLYVFLYGIKPTKPLLISLLFIVLLNTMLFLGSTINKQNTQQITFYHIRNNVAINCQQGKNSLLIADTLLLADKDKFHFHLQQHIWANNLKNIDTIKFTHYPKVYTINKHRIYVNTFAVDTNNKNNLILLTAFNKQYLKQQVNKKHINCLVINNSFSQKHQQLIENFAQTNELNYKMLAKTGYVQISF